MNIWARLLVNAFSVFPVSLVMTTATGWTFSSGMLWVFLVAVTLFGIVQYEIGRKDGRSEN